MPFNLEANLDIAQTNILIIHFKGHLKWIEKINIYKILVRKWQKVKLKGTFNHSMESR